LLLQEIDQTENGLSLRLARQCVTVLYHRYLKQQEDNIFEQLKEAEEKPETLKELSQALRSIRQQKKSPPLLEFYN